MANTTEVLLVEDDPMIARTLCMGLRYEGFVLTHAVSVAEAMHALADKTFELIVLDVGLPDGDGVSLCRQIRQLHSRMPILMLSARTDENTAVTSIEGGADDYIRKPCGLRELCARMRRLLHLRGADAGGRDCARFGNIEMDIQRRQVSVADKTLQLGKKEYDALLLLVRAAGDVVTRDRILDQILSQSGDDSAIYDRTIDSHLSHLRRKLKDSGSVVRIVAIYGVGYKLEIA